MIRGKLEAHRGTRDFREDLQRALHSRRGLPYPGTRVCQNTLALVRDFDFVSIFKGTHACRVNGC